MPKLLMCPRGHRWEPVVNSDASISSCANVCPVCGAEAETEAEPSGSNWDYETEVFASPSRRSTPDLDSTSFRNYEVLDEVGRGGMGVVYRAVDLKNERTVALKTLPKMEPTALRRFKLEFRSLASVVHPNVVTLHELVSDGQTWFFTMELIEGVTFLDYVWRGHHEPFQDSAQNAPLCDSSGSSDPAREKLSRLRESLRQLSSGVQAIHEAGFLHRDIKPSNVLVARDGRVVVLDFGLVLHIAREDQQSSTQHILGTVPYMSPEQASGKPVTQASDWYSVGAILYQALTARPPFVGNPIDVLLAKQQRAATPPCEVSQGIPADLNDLCVGLLQRDATQRPSALALTGEPGDERPEARGHASLDKPSSPEIPWVGRERHLEALDAYYGEMQKGQALSVFVHGHSGMGKSALTQRFLESLRERHLGVVLGGRCYERESVPYKAFDSLIDELSAYLMRLPENEAAALLPRDVSALARVFPVLRRVETVASAPRRHAEIPDQQELRRRAFASLRELLARIGDRVPLVLSIDDLQWGDVDSASLFSDLFRPPDAPVFLFVGCYRSDDAETSPFLCALQDLQRKGEMELEQRELVVGPLEHAESVGLAERLLGPDHASSRELAAVIARESGGSPLFVRELVRQVQLRGELVAHDRPAGQLVLDEVLWDHVLLCHAEERRLLEVVSVAGQPLHLVDAFRAAGIGTPKPAVLKRLEADHFIRIRGSDEDTEVETYHDRVREAVVAHLTDAELTERHQQLAETLERSGQAPTEMVASHFQGAGDTAKAAKYYRMAAEQAAKALAFDRAAEFYRLALDLRSAEDDESLGLRRKLADALANAGRGLEAALAYLAASQEANPRDAAFLRRQAAMQYVLSGHIDEGLSALQQVLASVRIKLPKTPFQALLSLLRNRLHLRLRGIHFRERAADQIPEEELTRIDICWTVGMGLSLVDPIRAAEFETRSLLLALRTGEPNRIARALAWEAGHISIAGSSTRRRTSRLMEAADAIARRVDEPHALGIVYLANGIVAYLQGRWKITRRFCNLAEDIFRDRCTGVAWELDTAHTFSLWALTYMGHVAELRLRRAALLKEALERGDLYAVTNLSTYIMAFDRLGADDPQGAAEELAAAQQRWTQQGFHVQHHNAVLAETLINLYQGKGEAAWRRVNEAWPFYKRSMLLRVQQVRIDIVQSRARSTLAAAAGSSNPDALLRDAERDARRLLREKTPWATAFSQLVRAVVAHLRRDDAQATALLEAASHSFDEVDMELYAAAARHRLGELLGGDSGESLKSTTVKFMKDQHLADPQAMTRLLVPGFDES